MIALIITIIGGTILKSKLTMYRPHLVFSRLAANTLGLAFAVAVSVVARYIQHDFLFG